jgi:hypothetical protein
VTRRRARYRSIYVNGIPVWECSRCGRRRPANTPHTTLTAHENECGQTQENNR